MNTYETVKYKEKIKNIVEEMDNIQLLVMIYGFCKRLYDFEKAGD